jgi:hypothetical protein
MGDLALRVLRKGLKLQMLLELIVDRVSEERGLVIT